MKKFFVFVLMILFVCGCDNTQDQLADVTYSKPDDFKIELIENENVEQFINDDISSDYYEVSLTFTFSYEELVLEDGLSRDEKIEIQENYRKEKSSYVSSKISTFLSNENIKGIEKFISSKPSVDIFYPFDINPILTYLIPMPLLGNDILTIIDYLNNTNFENVSKVAKYVTYNIVNAFHRNPERYYLTDEQLIKSTTTTIFVNGSYNYLPNNIYYTYDSLLNDLNKIESYEINKNYYSDLLRRYNEEFFKDNVLMISEPTNFYNMSIYYQTYFKDNVVYCFYQTLRKVVTSSPYQLQFISEIKKQNLNDFVYGYVIL